ncbi:MAG: lipase [Saccharofermentans sp.]|nr:lipase [Saccharofermentans sp.]
MSKFTKWVACWGNATSITDRTTGSYAKDITLRYPVKMCFDADKIRIRFSNLTGTEPVTLRAVLSRNAGEDRIDPASSVDLLLGGSEAITIPAGEEAVTDPAAMDIRRGEILSVSIYLESYTQMNAGVLITGPLSRGQYSYGNFMTSSELPLDKTRKTNWFYFLNTIDVFTEEKNKALICYGDSITAQAWPDLLIQRCFDEGFTDTAVIRRAVSGTRILRQYDCITYAAYGLKGSIRFPVEMNTAGVSSVIIQHGINDIIHPVGTDVNPFRPWEDMPSSDDLIEGVRDIYVSYARGKGIKIYSGTLLPIKGWRTYADFREKIRNEFNSYLRSSSDFDGCVDFDMAVRDPDEPSRFRDGYDSGDHLHPSMSCYVKMADTVSKEILL